MHVILVFVVIFITCCAGQSCYHYVTTSSEEKACFEKVKTSLKKKTSTREAYKTEHDYSGLSLGNVFTMEDGTVVVPYKECWGTTCYESGSTCSPKR